ncbi:amidohydrolase family protein [Staphylococcus kloosii]|uniref:Amidohydrolase n=1 Tax=Staphylococcus kloosii TaxID=29384 RepID=A0ABQ0XKL0_9STAP|nr:amidohydrolase family protein [Staphylococcus kloosii]AVQ34808.1 amidohydrolase [Staphylococcus kloosii]PNZ06618.1 amidohydrolase [Staphylococcus kloosii]PTJ76332.1 amidohydrolase [Staphylococcus kloosii]GEP81905.1 amidohydrolase [Staphylococcus kloosii]
MNKIDMHSHYISPGFAQFLDDYFDGQGDGVPTPHFSIDNYLSLMQEADIDYGVLSISSPHLSAAPDEEMLKLTEEVNDYGANLTKSYKDKIGFFASLPLPLVEESVRAIDYALDVQNAHGFTLPTNARGIYLGDQRLDDILAKLNERHALVAIHPNEPKPINDDIKAEILTPLMEFFFDTTRTIIFMNQNNVFSRYPNIKWIVPHSGALLPIIVQRVDMGNKMFDVENQPDDLEQTMQSLYFDLAGKVLPHQLPTLLTMVDENKIVYGADAPYTTDNVVKLLNDELESSSLLTDEQRQKLFYDNAQNLISN